MPTFTLPFKPHHQYGIAMRCPQVEYKRPSFKTVFTILHNTVIKLTSWREWLAFTIVPARIKRLKITRLIV